MWRCHCGEINLDTAAHCPACRGPRSTHEDKDAEPHVPERDRIVYMGMLGMGLGPQRDRDRMPPRSLTEAELNAYFTRARWQRRLSWLVAALVGLAGVALVVWQILRTE